MNYELIQKALDRVATEMDKKGYADLADKVDHYCGKLEKATDGQKKLIAKALKVISIEANKRDKEVTKKDTKAGKKSISKNRVAALRRKMALRNRKRAKAGKAAKTSTLAKVLEKYDADKKANKTKNLRAKRKSRLAE